MVFLLAQSTQALDDLTLEAQAERLIKEAKLRMREGLDSQKIFQEAFEIKKKLATKYSRLGQTQFLAGNYERAIEFFNRALEYHYQDILARIGLGKIHFREGNYEKALEVLAEVIKYDAGHSDARDLLKQVLKKMSKTDTNFHYNRQFSLPCQIVSFLESDSLRIEFAGALPKVGVSAAGIVRRVDINLQIDLRAMDDGEDISFSESPSHFRPLKGNDLRKNYILLSHVFKVPYESYDFLLKAGDRRILSYGTYQTLIRPPMSDTFLSMSDLLLASNINTNVPFPEKRTDLSIAPNPLRVYTREEPIFVYFELYNLLPEVTGETEFQIAYEFRWPDAEEIDLQTFEAVDNSLDSNISENLATLQLLVPYLHRRGIEMDASKVADRSTRMVIPYIGLKMNEIVYLQIETKNLLPGIQKLVISAKDLIANETIERSALVRVLE